VTDPNVVPNEGNHLTSLSLLERVRAQDQEAWAKLVGLYAPLVDHWVRQVGLQDADGADVRQEVFLAVARNIADFRRDRPGDSFRGWLATITYNKIRDHVRKRRTNAAQPGEHQALLAAVQVAESDSNSEASNREAKRILYRQAIELIAKDFQENSRQAFWRVVIDGQSPAEVAAALGLSVNAVYLAKGRVLARLREEFIGVIEN
jgi:RNA polymerase sigma-70 factor, ECF subfamily